MRGFVVPVADLLLGARCAGCGGPALLLCRPCGAQMTPAPTVVREQPVLTIAAGVNADVLRRVVVAWKEQGVSRLTEVLDVHLATAVVPHLRPGRAVSLVPVPSSRRSRRRRGSDLVADLAAAAARRLRTSGVEVDVVPAIAYARTTLDQAGLGRAERQANLSGAFRAVRRAALRGRDVIVVDDISTTGATVAEAVRVLTEAGRRPLGASVVAATPRLAETRR